MRRNEDRNYRSSKHRTSSKSPTRGKTDKRDNFYCDYCKQQFLSKSVYHDHCKSEFHKEKVAFVLKSVESNIWLCHSCEKGFDSKVTLDQHCLMLRHQAMYRVDGMPKPGQPGGDPAKAETKEPPAAAHEHADDKTSRSRNSLSSSSSGKKYYCEICDVDCLNSSNHRIHLESWRHRAAADRQKEKEREKEKLEDGKEKEKQSKSSGGNSLKLGGKLANCYMCNVTYETERGYLDHLEESRHQKKINLMRPPFNCAVCKIKNDTLSTFCSHLRSRGHIERSAKEKPVSVTKEDSAKFKKAFQKPKAKGITPDRKVYDNSTNEDLRVQLTKEKDSKRSGSTPVSAKKTDPKSSTGPMLVDYRHDSSAALVRSESERSNLREQLMKERDEEWGKYKKLEEEYRRLCVDEEYIQRRITFYEETDPRRVEDASVLLKIQRSLGDINEELTFRDKMIQEKENFILGTNIVEGPAPAEKPAVPIAEPPKEVAKGDDSVVVDYFHGTDNQGRSEVSEKKPQSRPAPETLRSEEALGPETPRTSKGSNSSSRTVVAAHNDTATPTKKDKEYLVELISDSLRKEREKIARRLGPELEHLDAMTKSRILRVVLERDAEKDSALPKEKERHRKSSKRKRHSKERPLSLADELQSAALRMLQDQHGQRPDPSVLIEQERKKLFGKDGSGGRSSSKRRRSQTSDDSSASSDSSSDRKSRRRSSRGKRKNDTEHYRNEQERGTEKYPAHSASSEPSSMPSPALKGPHPYMPANALAAHSEMLARAGLAGGPGMNTSRLSNPFGFPPGMRPGFPPGPFPPGIIPTMHPLTATAGFPFMPQMPPYSSNMVGSIPSAKEDPPAVSESSSITVKDEPLYPDLPPLQSSSSSLTPASSSPAAIPTSRVLHGRRHLPTPPPAADAPSTKSERDQLSDILASGVLDKIGAGSALNVVDLLREQLVNLERTRSHDAQSPESKPLFPSYDSGRQSTSGATPIKSILKKRSMDQADDANADQGTEDTAIGAPVNLSSSGQQQDPYSSHSVDGSRPAEAPADMSMPSSVDDGTGYSSRVDRDSYARPRHSEFGSEPRSLGERDSEHGSYSGSFEARSASSRELYSRYDANGQLDKAAEMRQDPSAELLSRGYPDKQYYGESHGDPSQAEYDSYRRAAERGELGHRDVNRPSRFDQPEEPADPYKYPDGRTPRYLDAASRIDISTSAQRRQEVADIAPPSAGRPYDRYPPQEYGGESGSRRPYPAERLGVPHDDRRYGPPDDARRELQRGYGPPRRGRPIPRP